MFNVGRGRGRGRGGAEPPRRREDRDARDSLVAANRRLEHGGLPPTVIAARPPRGPRGRGRAGFGLPPNVRGRSAATGANATGGRGGGWAGRAADTYRPPASPRAERERNGDRELLKREPEDDRMPTPTAAAQPASEQQPARHQRFSPERTTSAAPSSVRPPAPRPVGLTLPPQIPRAYSPTRPVDMSYGGPSYLKPQQPEAGPSRPPGGAPVRPPLSSVTSAAPSTAPPSVRPPPPKPAPPVTTASGHRPNGAGVKEEPLAPEERPPIQKLKFKPRVLAVRKASSSTPEVPDAAPVREDEKMDLGGEIDELEEETLGNGTGSGAEGVLAFSRTELPKDLWSKKRSILNDARTAFRKQHISRLSKEGKTVTQVFWRDDGVAFPWVRKTHNRAARSPSDSPIPLDEASTAKASPKAPASTVIDILSSSPTPLRQLSPPRPPATPTKPKPPTTKPSPSAKEDRHSLPPRPSVTPLANAAVDPPAGPSTDDGKKLFLKRIYGSLTQPGEKYRGPWPYRVFLKIPERWATKQGRASDRSGYEDWAVAQAQIARAKDAQGEPTRHFRLDHVHNDVLPISWAPMTADSSLLTQFPLEALSSEESVNALLENEAAQAEFELKEKARLKRERRAARKAAAKEAAKEAAKGAAAKEAAAKEAAAKEAAAQSAPAMPPKRSRSQSSSEVEEPLEEPRPEPPKKKKQKKVALLQTTPRASRAQQEEELALNDGRPHPHPPQAPQVAPAEIGKPTIVPPKPPPPATSAFLQELEHRILQKFASIDRWTRMLAEYPASAETLRKQIDRMQEEIFGIQQEIDAEKTRLKSAPA